MYGSGGAKGGYGPCSTSPARIHDRAVGPPPQRHVGWVAPDPAVVRSHGWCGSGAGARRPGTADADESYTCQLARGGGCRRCETRAGERHRSGPPGGRTRRLAPRGTGLRGELRSEGNDCGEQTGDPSVEGPRNTPLCIEARVVLGDQKDVVLMILVGSLRGTISGTAPEFYGGTVIDAPGRHAPIRSVSPLPAAVASPRRRPGPSRVYSLRRNATRSATSPAFNPSCAALIISDVPMLRRVATRAAGMTCVTPPMLRIMRGSPCLISRP
jgi:hypothetical protein